MQDQRRYARHSLVTALMLAVACGVIYAGVASGFSFQFTQTQYAHHILMADALLHGRFDIRPEALQHKGRRMVEERLSIALADAQARGVSLDSSNRAELEQRALERVSVQLGHDWALVDGRIYGYWGVLTPLAVAPFVWALGLDVSDSLISTVFGAINVALFYLVLRRSNVARLVESSESCRVALAVLFALGTVHFSLACAGRVWFAVQIVTLTATLGAILAACTESRSRKWDALAGLLFGMALLGRSIVVLLALFFLLRIWARSVEGGVGTPRRREFLRRVAIFGLCMAPSVAVQAFYNHARFGSWRNSGFIATLETGSESRYLDAYRQHGLFSPVYLPENLKCYFGNFRLPLDASGRRTFDPEGNSMLLVTPPLIFALLACRAAGRVASASFIAALAAGVIPLVAALLLFFATGAAQFGNRYLLDAMPLLLLLVACGVRGRTSAALLGLLFVTIGVNTFGAIRLCESAALVGPGA